MQKKRVSIKISKDFTTDKFDSIRQKIKDFYAPKASDNFTFYWGVSHPIIFVLSLIISAITMNVTVLIISLVLLSLSLVVYIYTDNSTKKFDELNTNVNTSIYDLYVSEFEKVSKYISSEINEYEYSQLDVNDFKSKLPKNSFFTRNQDFIDKKIEIEDFTNRTTHFIVNKLNSSTYQIRVNFYLQLLTRYKDYDLSEYYTLEQNSIRKKYDELCKNGFSDLNYTIENRKISFFEKKDFQSIVDKQYTDVLNSHLTKKCIDELYIETKNMDLLKTIDYFKSKTSEGYGGFQASNTVSKILKVKFDMFKNAFTDVIANINKNALLGFEKKLTEIDKLISNISSYEFSNNSLSNHIQQLFAEKALLMQKNDLQRSFEPIRDSAYKNVGYSNVCWKCHNPLNTSKNEKCSVCGWLICNYCGACQEGGCSGYTERNRKSR